QRDHHLVELAQEIIGIRLCDSQTTAAGGREIDLSKIPNGPILIFEPGLHVFSVLRRLYLGQSNISLVNIEVVIVEADPSYRSIGVHRYLGCNKWVILGSKKLNNDKRQYNHKQTFQANSQP